MNTKEKAIYTFNKKYSKTSLQLVVRVPLVKNEIQKVLIEMLKQDSIKGYVIAQEEPNTERRHWHVLILSIKKLKILPTRALWKTMIEDFKKTPKTYSNGILNMSHVNNAYKMLCYVYKDWVPPLDKYYIPHGILTETIEFAKQDSYQKIKSLSKEITKLLVQVKSGNMSVVDASVTYRKMKRKIPKDVDPNWIKFMRKCIELSIREDDIQSDTERVYSEFKISDNY